MNVHEAKRRIEQAASLVQSVIRSTGNPALRGSLRIANDALVKVCDTILFIPFEHDNEHTLNLPLDIPITGKERRNVGSSTLKKAAH